ncbi:2-acylglycerol O-acyltransferase 2-A isoform X4 [Hippoglossus stenolepis]|uniref:2-acylglycerol O-acyltransferase 2-A isoform X4 n=1 Tax=Hippoglossus stenolepis TaxID=195615 RepID=UPI001FB008DF|nr:2-acylglycerol O-acyltransferase 2-A isoform X4 [Hippoglossus stenolepis]
MKIEFAPMNVPLRRRLGGSTVDVLLPGSRCSGGGGAFGNFCTESTGFSRLFPGLTSHLLMLPFWFRVPLFREYIMSGGLVSSSKSSLSYLLVPVFSFGENELFDQIKNPSGSNLRMLQNQLQSIMGFAVPLFHARGVFQYSLGLMPYRKSIHTWENRSRSPRLLVPAARTSRVFIKFI